MLCGLCGFVFSVVIGFCSCEGTVCCMGVFDLCVCVCVCVCVVVKCFVGVLVWKCVRCYLGFDVV